MSCQIFGSTFERVANSTTRFYKYKMAETVQLPVGMCEELLLQDSLVKLFDNIKAVFLATFNIEMVYVPISFQDMRGNGTFIGKIKDVEGVLFPAEISDIALTKSWYYTSYFGMTEIVLMTSPPKMVDKYSTNFFNMDDSVVAMIVLGIATLPWLSLVSLEIERFLGPGLKRLRSSSIKSLLKKYPKLCWSFLCIFFCEPFDRVPKSIPWRMIFGSWLVAISILSTYMSSVFKTELYSSDYLYIDSLDSFSANTELALKFVENSNSHNYVKQWEKDVARRNAKLSLKSRSSFADIEDILGEDFYRAISRGDFGYIIPRFYLEAIMGFILEGAKTNNLFIYYSKEHIKGVTFVFPVNPNLKQCPHFMEQVNLAMLVAVETKFPDYFYFKHRFYVSKTEWKKPPKSLSAISLKSSVGAFQILFNFLGLSTLIFFLEMGVLCLRLFKNQYP